MKKDANWDGGLCGDWSCRRGIHPEICIQINYRYKYNKIFIIQHQRCLGTLPAGSSAVSMLISCEIPNKHILASFSHLTICLGNKWANIAVKRAASPFPVCFNFCLMVCMAWHPTKIFLSFLKVIFLSLLLWRALKIWQHLYPQASFLCRHHTRQYSVKVPSTFPTNGIVFFVFFHSLFHDVPNTPVFSLFITGLEGLHSSEALKRFLNIHWRMCNYGFKNETSTNAIRSQTEFTAWRQT